MRTKLQEHVYSVYTCNKSCGPLPFYTEIEIAFIPWYMYVSMAVNLNYLKSCANTFSTNTDGEVIVFRRVQNRG